MTPRSGRAIAWLSFLLGIAVSIAGNVGHAASDGMRTGEWAGAAFWPTALMLSIEILTRVRWQPEARWKLAKMVGLTVVATGAAILSYRHLAGLLTYWGEDGWNAHIGPLVVDGMMLLAATALLSISKEGTAHVPTRTAADSAVDSDAGADAVAEDSATGAGGPGIRPESAPAVEETPATHQPPASQPTVIGRATNVRETENGLEWNFEPTPEPEESPGPVPAPEPSKSKLHVVETVSASASEEAALQAFIESGGSMKAQDLIDKFGMSRSTAYRRRGEWQSKVASQRIAGR